MSSVAETVDRIEAQITKQLNIIGKASAACAMNTGELDEASEPNAYDVPASVAEIRRLRAAAALALEAETDPEVVRRPTLDAAVQVEVESVPLSEDSRVAQLTAEIDRLKAKHRAQLLAAEKDMALLRAKSRIASSTPPAQPVESASR